MSPLEKETPAGGGNTTVEEAKPKTGPRTPRAKLGRKQVSRILDIYHHISSSSTITREILATLLDVEASPDALTVEIAVGSKTAVDMLRQLADLASMPELDTALTLLGAGRAEMRPLWRLAQTLHGTEKQIPGQDIAAAKQLSKLLHTLPAPTVSALNTASQILG